MDAYNQILRRRLREAAARPPAVRVDGTVKRGTTTIGAAGGIYYIKRRGGFTISLAGQIADEPDGEYLMVLWPDEYPDAQAGDTLETTDATYRVLAVQNPGAYQTYRLEAIV